MFSTSFCCQSYRNQVIYNKDTVILGVRRKRRKEPSGHHLGTLSLIFD